MRTVMILATIILSILHPWSYASPINYVPPHYMFFAEGLAIGILHSVEDTGGGVATRIGDLDLKFVTSDKRQVEDLRSKVGSLVTIGYAKSDFDDGNPRILDINPTDRHYCPASFDDGLPSDDSWQDRIFSAHSNMVLRKVKIALVERSVGPIDTTLTIVPAGRSKKEKRLTNVSRGDLYFCLKQVAQTQSEITIGIVYPFVGSKYINSLQVDSVK